MGNYNGGAFAMGRRFLVVVLILTLLFVAVGRGTTRGRSIIVIIIILVARKIVEHALGTDSI
jgi:hypothetical protein